MGRLFAEHAKIARRADQRLAEVVLPNAVDDDAHRQRIGRIGDRVCQLTAAAPVFEERRVFTGDDL